MATGSTAASRETSSSGKLWQRFFQPVDIASLVFFRIAFGCILLYEVISSWTSGRVYRDWVEPTFHFGYDFFDWVKPWPGAGMYIHWTALGLLAALIALGCFYRVAMALFCAGFTYVFLLEESRYLNHFYFICLVSLVMVFVPAHRAFSVDARRRPEIRSDTAPAWALWILCFLMGAVYFFGGIAKLNADWLRGEPMRFWLAMRTDYPVLSALCEEEWMVYLFSYGGLLLDLLIVPLLLWRRTRLFAFVWATSFHLLNKWLLGVGIFPWFSIAATLLFFPPDWPRRVRARLFAKGESMPETEVPSTSLAPLVFGTREKATLWLLGIFVAIQILLPFRKHLYPGNANWTEQGHNFAWHMKLRDKRATAEFTIHEPATGRSWPVDLKSRLTGRQIDKMSIRPHMIRKFARHLARERERAGHGKVEVRARVLCSLNGRPPQLFIDPDIDLASVRPSWGAASWILPLTEPLPPPAVTRRQAAWMRGDLKQGSVPKSERPLLMRLEGD